MAEMLHLPADALRSAMDTLFQASGSAPDEAARVAHNLVGANLTGHDSHGVIRVPAYLASLRAGRLQSDRHVTVLREAGAVAVLSGDWGYGQVLATEAMEDAIARARKHHVAAVGLTDTNHIGRLADYALMAAEQGMVALLFTASGGAGKIVAPFGGRQGKTGTNPMACAWPGPRGPLVFDMATSVLAEGKVQVMRAAGKEAPPSVLIDKDGNPTTRPADFYDGGALLPLGAAQGYKGYLLNFLVEVLGGLLTGGGVAGNPRRPEGGNNCTLMIVLDISAFRENGAFTDDLGQLVDFLKATPALPGQEVLFPGEVEQRCAAERERGGIPLAPATVQALQAELDRYHVPLRLEPMALTPVPAAG